MTGRRDDDEGRRGDIVIVVAQGDLGKLRPAVVVQADELAAGSTSVIVCPRSSEAAAASIARPIVEPSKENGLHLRSQAMVDKISSLRKERIRARIGTIEGASMQLIDRAPLIVLGLTG